MAQDKIKIPSRSYAANQYSSKVYPYEMDVTKTVRGYAIELIDWLVEATGGEKANHALQSLVINCHGKPAHLHIGYEGFSWDNLHAWKRLRHKDGTPRVKTIYITACNVISFTGPKDGNLFCGAIAKNANAYVIASNKMQSPSACPKGYIDEYEGGVWEYTPLGSNRSWDGEPKAR